MKNEIEKTLSYYQIFDYFLKKEDLYDFLHTDKFIKKEDLESAVKKDFKILNGYVFPQKTIARGIQKKLKLQKKNEDESFFKFTLARRVAHILSFIPSVKLIAVSGALAMKNAGGHDDIDFFIVASSRTIWATRFFCILFLTLLGARRFYNDKNVKNKICLNFFVDENHLQMKKKNLYTAHEIAQMKILFDKDKTYEKLIKENKWGEMYLANWFMKKRINNKSRISRALDRILIGMLRVVEPIFHFAEFAYMKRKITHEIIEDGVLMFHPRDYSKEILKKYKYLISQRIVKY